MNENRDVKMSEESSNSLEITKNSDRNVTVLGTQQKRELSSWGLPDTVLKRYELLGVVSMFQWQVECLSNAKVLAGGNLIYSAPTSAGKTLVAEMLVIKTVLERKKKAIIILPFVSVVREKMFYFQNLLSSSGIRVAGLMGSHSLPGGFKNVDIAVCTIEKANGLVNRLLEEGSLHKVGMVVVDELHLLGDPFRGYLLELLLTKILYMCKSNEKVNIQVIGMSATLPNLPLLATWLGADLYQTDFRPVPLKEFLKIGPSVYDDQIKRLYDIQPLKDIQDDPDHVVQLCLETLLQGHSVLMFCPTKQWCERLSQRIAQGFRTIGLSGSDLGQELRKQLNSSAIAEALEQLRRCPVGLDKYLGCSVAFGVAFHHAGLTIDERDILESCFRSGTLRVLVATSTLSSGVNLPARRVIIRSPVFHGKCMDTETYKQMVGRAGRTGRDTLGESFLVCSKAEEHIGKRLIKSDLKPVQSCLGHGELAASLKRAILEVIASGVASTPQQVAQYTSLTLLATTKSELQNPISACVQFLENNELIRLQKDEDEEQMYVPTPLGLACLAASLPPDEGLQLFAELQKARHCFVIDTDLHIIYEVLNIWEQLPASMQKVGELVGVEEGFMARAMRGTLSLTSSRQKMSIHRRFYTALALHDLVNEVPLNEVAVKYGCSRGMLQSLQQSAATFAGMVTAFCRRLGWSSMELLISQFQDRLQFGVHRELCDLMKLDALNAQRARALFDDGITSLADLAVADVCDVENALHKSIPFQSSKELNGETSFETKQRNKLRKIWVTGHEGLAEREAAFLLISEARAYLQRELGLKEAKWDCSESDSSGYDSPSPLQESHRLESHISNNLNQLTESCDDKNAKFCKDKLLSDNKNQSDDVQSELSYHENSRRMLKQSRNKSVSSHHSELSFVQENENQNGDKRQSSLLSDEDCLSSSPVQYSSKRNNQTSCFRVESYRKSKLTRTCKNSSYSRRTKRKKQSSLVKKTDSSVIKQNKLLSSDLNHSDEKFDNVTNLNEIALSSSVNKISCLLNYKSEQCEKDENEVFLENNETEHGLVSKQTGYTECGSKNESIDYFDSSLYISESELHKKTQHYINEGNNIKTNLSHPQNTHIKMERTSDNIDDKKSFLNSFIPSLRIADEVPIKIAKLEIKGSPDSDKIENTVRNSVIQKQSVQHTNSSFRPSPKQPGKLEENIINLSERMDNERLSSDFFSTPASGGKEAPVNENDNDSPSLFGDSFVVDTQLDEVLDGCCNKNEGPYERDISSKKKMPSGSIRNHITNNKITSLTGTCVVNKTDTDYQCLENKNELKESEANLTAPKHNAGDQTNLLCRKVTKKNKKIKHLLKKTTQTLPKGIITSRELMKLKHNAGTADLSNTKIYDKNCLSGEIDWPCDSNIVKNSASKVEDLHGEDTELSTIHDIQSEEINFESICHESTLQTPLIRIKKGLVPSLTYNLHEKLRSESSKSKARKRKISVSDINVNCIDGLNESKKIKISENSLTDITCDSFEDIFQEKQIIMMEEDSKKLSSLPAFDRNVQFVGHKAENIDSEDDCITDSFLDKAFDTYFELEEESGENKNKNGINKSRTQNIGKSSVLQENKENVQNEIAYPEIKCGNEVVNNLNNEEPCVISKSLLEDAFNSCWEDDITFKAESGTNGNKYNSKTNGSENSLRKNISVQDNQIVNYDKAESVENSSFKGRKEENKSNRRRSPRLLEASKKKINHKEAREICTKTSQSASGSRLKKLKTKNVTKRNEGKSTTTDYDISGDQSETPVRNTYSLNFNQEQQSNFKEMEITACKMESNKHIFPKRTEVNKVLHFSDDSSDDGIENDVIVSSQSDDQTERKRMEGRFTIAELCDIHLIYGEARGVGRAAIRIYREHFPKRRLPAGLTFVAVHQRGYGSSTLDGLKLKLSGREVKINPKIRAASQSLKKTDIKASSSKSELKIVDKTSLWNSINIVDVCAHDKVWTTFQEELSNISLLKFAFAVACEQFTDISTPVSENFGGIGARIIGHKKKKSGKILNKDLLYHGEQLVCGIALCFGGKDAFFISFKQDPQCYVIVQKALNVVTNLFKRGMALCAFDLKEHLKSLSRCCGIMMQYISGHDPKVADWLIEPEGREKNFIAMVLRYCGNEHSKLAEMIGTNWGVGSPALDLRNDTSPRLRACIEAVLTLEIVDAQLAILEEKNLSKIYSEVEMPTLFCLAGMELNGIGFDRDEAERLRSLLEQQLMVLEQNTYRLAGHPFSLTSSADIAKVLYRELGLTTGKLSNKQKRPSTSKEALIKIKKDHPLPELILQWRKLNAMVTKTLCPLLVPGCSTGRIFSCSVLHTATGRISMHEPNLQNIPRDFDVIIDEMEGKSCTSISMRLAFIPSSGKLFISADYSQLELRILAHLAKDSVLSPILNSDRDVFRNIAASWNKIPESQVTGEQRQWAKQICYGILYGMGAKALGEQLGVDEEDAAVFMDTFKNSYSGVKIFLLETVTQCHKEGYIVTLLGRRRYLPGIYSTNSVIKAQSERQAVNSTVQGSAADVAKKGMILVESQLRNAGFVSAIKEERECIRTASLVLHLHDELLYEVSCEHVMEAAQIIKCGLENAVKLSVQLPVKVKIGESWGSMKEVSL